MDEKSNHKADFSSIEDRIRIFRDYMAPALHLFPKDITDRLTKSGFFTAPASTKYHGAYEGGLFDHSYNVTSTLVTLTHWKKFCVSGITWAPSWTRRSGTTTPVPFMSIRTCSGRIQPT